jgi:hypothetical protein
VVALPTDIRATLLLLGAGDAARALAIVVRYTCILPYVHPPLTLSQELPLHTVVLVVNGTSPPQALDVLPLQPIPAVAAVASHAIPTALTVDLVAQLPGSVVSLLHIPSFPT